MNRILPLPLALVLFAGLTSVNWSSDATVKFDTKGRGTRVSAVLDTPVPADRNLLWCASFQIAWDGAAGRFGRPLELMPRSGLADTLNKEPFNPAWVGDKGLYATHGAVKDGVLGRINSELARHGARASDFREQLANGDPNDLVFYAMILKDLKFPKPYGQMPTVKIGAKEVKCFGFSPGQQGTGPLLAQTVVHHYKNPEDFVIELKTTDSNEHLLLARLPARPATLADLNQAVCQRRKDASPAAVDGDTLLVPHIVIVETAVFSELHGSRVVKEPAWFVRSATQTLDIKLDEQGVKLRSEANVSFGCSAAPEKGGRVMILRPPFAMVMQRKNAPKPYFACWIANADLLGDAARKPERKEAAAAP